MEQYLSFIPVFLVLIWIGISHIKHVVRTHRILEELKVEQALMRKTVSSVLLGAVSKELISPEEASDHMAQIFDRFEFGSVGQHAYERTGSKVRLTNMAMSYLKSLSTFRGISGIFMTTVCLLTVSLIVLMVIKVFE